MVNKVHVNQRLDSLRDDLKGRVSNVLFGTDDAAPTANDTSLGNQVASKSASTGDKATGEVVVSAKLSAAEGNGNTLKEIGEEDGSSNLLSRIVFAGISKTSDFELEARITDKVENP